MAKTNKTIQALKRTAELLKNPKTRARTKSKIKSNVKKKLKRTRRIKKKTNGNMIA